MSENVPAFGCVVYISKSDGLVRGRVANLDGLCVEAPTERGVLGKIVPAFRERVAALLASDEEIPWIDPPMEKSENEEERFLPIHL